MSDIPARWYADYEHWYRYRGLMYRHPGTVAESRWLLEWGLGR